MWPVSVELDVGGLKLSKEVKVQGLEPCDCYTVSVDFSPIRFSVPGEYEWRVAVKAGGYVDSRSGSIEVRSWEVVVTTDKNTYAVGETVEIRVTMPPSIRCLCYEHEWEVVVVRVRDGSVAEE